MKNKIIPHIWFSAEEGDVQRVNEYYKNVFGDNFSAGAITDLGENPNGRTQICEVKFFGQPYTFMNTQKEYKPLNDAFSIILNCSDQSEIDKYWNYFTSEGKESYCGWCIDKFGLRWQILPHNLNELMQRPNATKVMLSQTKIIIDEYGEK